MTTILFACVHNAGRSQMAAAWFNRLADAAKARAISAGTQPGARVHPEVVAAMSEAGIELTDATPVRLTPELARTATMLITMGCGDECPVVPGAGREDWPLEDPKGKPVEVVRAIRDDIRERVRLLIERQGWGRLRAQGLGLRVRGSGSRLRTQGSSRAPDGCPDTAAGPPGRAGTSAPAPGRRAGVERRAPARRAPPSRR